jgi:hypothetical protein
VGGGDVADLVSVVHAVRAGGQPRQQLAHRVLPTHPRPGLVLKAGAQQTQGGRVRGNDSKD